MTAKGEPRPMFYTSKELLDVLKIGSSTLAKIPPSVLPRYKIRAGVRYRVDDVERYLATCRIS